MDETSDLGDLLSEQPPQFIPIDKCVTGKIQAKQNTQIKEDDPLVISIRDMGGLIHPIIVKKFEENNETKYDVITGQRRLNAHILLEMKEIKAFVISRDLSEHEMKVITWNEGMQHKPMTKKDYVNVIENFYTKYGGTLSTTAKALGISTTTVKKYLIEARLSDRVVELIDAKEFTIDTVIQALKALGDDEESVDEDALITTAKELQKLPPSKRKDVVKKRKGGPHRTIHTLKIELTDSQMKKLSEYTKRMQYENVEDMIMEIVDRGLAELEDD